MTATATVGSHFGSIWCWLSRSAFYLNHFFFDFGVIIHTKRQSSDGEDRELIIIHAIQAISQLQFLFHRLYFTYNSQILLLYRLFCCFVVVFFCVKEGYRMCNKPLFIDACVAGSCELFLHEKKNLAPKPIQMTYIFSPVNRNDSVLDFELNRREIGFSQGGELSDCIFF